jgi:hypothetical protein
LTRLETYSKQNKKTKRDNAETESLTQTSEGSITGEDVTASDKRKRAQTFALNDFSSDEDSDDEEYNESGCVLLKQADSDSLISSESDSKNFDTNQVFDSDTSGISNDEEGPEASAVQWKANLALKAADAFLERQSTTLNLWKLVYGK